MNPFDLTGKNVLVTGASSGLGRQTAITCSELGARVFLTARNEDRLRETFSGLTGDGHQVLPADLRSDEQIEKLVASLPGLHGVVYSVGTSTILPAGFLTREKFRESFESNFNSVVLLNERLIRLKKLVRNQCSIVWISSVSTQYPFVGGGLYVSAKAAVEGYARVLAVELARKGIRSNCIRPGYVRTPMTDLTEELSKDAVRKIEEKQPLGLGTPEDVANTAVFFLSDASKWITAANLILGGG